MTKYEPTNQEIHATDAYQQAKAISELIPIPEYSQDVRDYEKKLDEYREVCGNLNSTWFGRFETNPSKPEFSENIQVFARIEEDLKQARALHANIEILVSKHKMEEKRQAEWQAIWDARRQQDIVRVNAFIVVKERLTQENKIKAKAERQKAKTA